MMTQEQADLFRQLIQTNLPPELAEGLVSKFVISVAVYTSDGEHAFGLLAPPDMPSWEVRGVLDYAHDMSKETTA